MSCKDCLYFKRCVVLGVELDMDHDKEADKNCRCFENTRSAKIARGGKLTNFERIKDMTVDEMTDFITDLTNGCEYGCKYCANFVDGECTKDGWMDDYISGCKKWLESEVSEAE